ncbi:MAG: hypothetical protein R3C49_01045 [Planctomycetaceae bacterium]
MTTFRPYQDVRILIPGYSIEDLPTELPEASANSLLNAFAVAWHPWLLQQARTLPEVHRAESLEMPTGPHILLVPDCSIDWLEHDWKQRFTEVGNLVLSHCSDRAQWLETIRTQLLPEKTHEAPGEPTSAPNNSGDQASLPEIDADLLAEFFAFGTCYLQVRLLSRRLHHFTDPDRYRLESAVADAVKGAMNGQPEIAREHLRHAFEALLDCREQVHPTDCFLVDLCLPSEQTTATELVDLIRQSPALSILCSGADLRRFDSQDGSFREAVQAALSEQRLALLTGHYHELRTTSGSVSSTYADIAASVQEVRSFESSAPLSWARRRFGLNSSLPTLLKHFEFESALHVVLDDGVYPDREYGQMNWEAPDGSRVPAVSRIPIAIDSGSSFLRFVDRCAESMQEDSSAVLLLARLPQLVTPWLSDLQIASRYAPILGRFVTLTEFVSLTRSHSSSIRHDESEYLSPHLIQSSVLKTEAPISSPAELHAAWSVLESAAMATSIAAVLKPSQANVSAVEEPETQLAAEEASRLALSDSRDSAATQQARLAAITRTIQQVGQTAAAQVQALVPARAADARGVFILNPLPWNRRASLKWIEGLQPPAQSSCIESAWGQGRDIHLSVNLPAGGFAWLHEAGSDHKPVSLQRPGGKPLAEGLLLRNQFYEVQLSERSGGIMSVTFHNSRNNRVSQQVAFRYENSKTVSDQHGEHQTAYATARMVSSKVISSGPFTGSIQTTSEIVDVVDGHVKAKFRQTVSVQRDSAKLKIHIEFDDVADAAKGNPWMTYYGCRFAWDNESAAIVRSVLGQPAGFRMERFEAPDYIEVSDSDGRLLILPHGRPYHRRTSGRMLDSLLMVEAETARSFRFTLDFDQPFPMRAAMEQQQPPLLLETSDAVPSHADSAWGVALSAKNIVVARSRVCPTSDSSASVAVSLLLQETEGRAADCRLMTARTPIAARLKTATGKTLQPLDITDTGITIPFTRYQLHEVELLF